MRHNPSRLRCVWQTPSKARLIGLVAFGDFSIDVGERADHPYGIGDLPGDLQIESLAAGLAHGAAGVGARVEGEDIFFFDMEGGEIFIERSSGQLALDPISWPTPSSGSKDLPAASRPLFGLNEVEALANRPISGVS